MPTVTIEGLAHDSYATAEEADAYLAASINSAWRDLKDKDQANRALVEASRLIDRQKCEGTKTDEAQATAWPRDGISGGADGETPAAVVAATCELASAFISGETDALTSPSTGSNTIRSLRAGSVAIDYFLPDAIAATRFPLIIQELLGRYLAGSSGGVSGPVATGVDGCSSFRHGYERNVGF
jgi:hypothetical protein